MPEFAHRQLARMHVSYALFAWGDGLVNRFNCVRDLGRKASFGSGVVSVLRPNVAF